MISTRYNRLIAQKVNNNERLAASRENANNRDEPVQYHEQTRHTSTLGEKLREAERLLPKKKVTFAKPVEKVAVVKPVNGLVVGSGKSSDKSSEEVEKDYKKQVPKVGGGNMEMAMPKQLDEPPKRVLGGAKKTVKGAKLLTKAVDASTAHGRNRASLEASANTSNDAQLGTRAAEQPVASPLEGGSAANELAQLGTSAVTKYSGLKWNDLIKAVCKDRKCAMKEAIAHIKSNNLYNRTSA
jgi:hypothetical protein